MKKMLQNVTKTSKKNQLRTQLLEVSKMKIHLFCFAVYTNMVTNLFPISKCLYYVTQISQIAFYPKNCNRMQVWL